MLTTLTECLGLATASIMPDDDRLISSLVPAVAPENQPMRNPYPKVKSPAAPHYQLRVRNGAYIPRDVPASIKPTGNHLTLRLGSRRPLVITIGNNSPRAVETSLERYHHCEIVRR